MGDDSLILREDGYIRMNFPVTSLTYHSNLNIILVKTDVGGVHVLDVNSGVILQSSCLSADVGGTLGVEYVPGTDRVFVWDSSGVGARTDYNGVLLLHTALQRPLPTAHVERSIRLELVLSEAVLLYQCLDGLDANSIEGLTDFVTELKNALDAEPVRKGVKAQKWSTVTISLPQSILRLVTTSVVQELKGQNRRVPALAIASAVGQRANELVPCSKDEETRPLMYSEAERKETFKRWPHMDYKWALPARMAQAGFYHQPSPSGDDRAMCFTCLVCLVCWEKSDEPWVEHERHSPNCPFVRGEYTHNVPISVTNATACAVPFPGVTVVSKGNTGEFIASGTTDGKINIWTFDCGLKLVKFIQLSAYDSIFSGMLTADSNQVWGNSIEKDTSKYGIELTAMAFIGNASQQELGWAQVLNSPPQYKENIEQETSTKTNKTKSSLVCAVIVTRTNVQPAEVPIKEDSSKALFDQCVDPSTESVQAMNDQNEAKSNLSPNKMLFLLTYDIHGSQTNNVTTVVSQSNPSGNSKPGGSKKVCTVARTDDANIYDDIYFQYSDEEPELAQCTNAMIDEHISNVINLNASSSKDDCKIWEPKKIILTKHYKVVPPPPPGLLQELQEHSNTTHTPASVLDFVGKLSQLKSWKIGGPLDSVGTKLADQTDAVVLQQTPEPHLSHYLMTGPVDISDIYTHQSISKWYDGGEGTEKVKVTTFGGSKVGTQTAAAATNTEGFESEPVLPPPDEVTQAIAIQCLSLPPMLNLREDSKITHLIPTEDKEHLLVVVSSIDPEKIKAEDETDNDGDTKMDVDDTELHDRLKSEAKAYFILYETFDQLSMYTLEDNPISYQELPFNESPVDLCLLPGDNDQYSFASVGIDGCLRLYSLPDFRILSEKRVPKGQFTSVTYCASVDRLSVSTKHGMIYFYAFNNGDKDSCGDQDEDEFANIDFDMLQRAPRDEVCGPTMAPVIIANKPELDLTDLETLITLTGSYGTNTAVPYSAVVPGFWCELSPAQRPRSDHQNNRTWRLQNTSSTWDEHFLELTLPYSVSLAHVEFSFSLHSICTTNLPVIMVTLLKQNLHGIGYKKDAAFSNRSESPIPVIDADMTNLDNPIHSEEYLQAHNAEILAGPLVLSSGLDTTLQSGVLTLTSPRLYRARGRTFLIHLKTLFDPAQDMSKGAGKSEDAKGKKFIGCDWLHQISLTVRSSPHTEVPLERQQRIAMLENNSYLNTLCEIAVGKDSAEMRRLALDNIIWVVSVRLQRMRLAKSEKGKDKSTEIQQMECIKVIEKHIDALIRNCILCGDRSIAKKCIRILLITSDGQKQILKPWKSTFELSLSRSVANCIPYIGACVSPGALRWLAALVQHSATPAAAPDFVRRLLDLLQHAAGPLLQRADPYQHLLRSRFGLYGLPFERTIFAPETPEVGRNGAPVTYANMLQPDSTAPSPPRHDQQLRELLNWPKDTTPDPKTPTPWWAQNNGAGVFGLGVSEATPLHVSCHLASDGTKLESAGYRHHAAVVSALPGATAAAQATNPEGHQLWNAMYEKELKEMDTKHPPGDPDPDMFEDLESSMMDCDPQDKIEYSDDRLFKEQEQCGIPWSALVTRPPQLTLLVERMHSGARRYIVLDFGHTVHLTDVIIPSCQDLVTLCIDIWVTSEETDGVKLAAAADIATKNLVLTDLQPRPLCRYMKITTIGRYGMSAMKCKIPLGWFYGEIANVSNIQASLNALNALHQDLSCRFRLATGKLIDLLNPYMEIYNGNAAHMMAYLNMNPDGEKVITAYHECIELQQQLHTCTNIMKKLQNNTNTDEGRKVAEMIENGTVTSNSLLHQASTDKLRVITENVVDMLLFFYFQMNEGQSVWVDVSREWCSTVTPLVWQCGGSTAGALATLVARVCGSEHWWGDALATALTDAFAASFAPPTPLDRCLVLVIYMCRKSMFSHWERGGTGAGAVSDDAEWHGVAHALSARALELVQSPRPQPALTAAVLTALAAVLDAVAAAPPATSLTRHSRWDWVSGGCIGSAGTSTSTRTGECKLQRRKLHKKLLHQMQELEAARRGIHDHLDEQQRIRLSIKTRMAMAGKRCLLKTESPPNDAYTVPTARCVGSALAASLASALVHHMLACDSASDADAMMLCAKVVGRLCALSGGANLLDPSCILGLARLTVSLPSWPRHALTTLLQDLVEFENTETPSTPPETASTGSDAGWQGHSSRLVRVTPTPFQTKPPRKNKGPSVADSKDMEAEEQLTQVAESDDSESSDEKLENYFLNPISEKESKTKVVVDNNTSISSNISRCCDARLESAGGGSGGAGEASARRALLATGTALAVAVRSDLAPPPPPPPPPAPAPLSPHATQPARHHPPLTHTLYDVFRHLALEFNNQMDCTFMENVVALWLTLNGSTWASGGAWSLSTLSQLAVPADTPRIRLASDTVTALLHSLTLLESVSIRCWVLSMQALAWIAALPLQTEGSTQTMGRVILECEHFVPAMVKFITMNVQTDGAVTSSELYLSGISIGAGAGAASALHSVLSRVVCTRGTSGALAMLRIVCAVWGKDSTSGTAYDLQATLLRLALPLLQLLAARHAHHAHPLFESIAHHSASWIRTYSVGNTTPAIDTSTDARVSGLLADVVRGASSQRRAPSRRTVLAQLVSYARKLLATPLPQQHQTGSSPNATPEQSQTDESKARHSGASDSTNMDDEKKQQAARHPCLADTVLQQPQIMRLFYKTLTLIEGVSSSNPPSGQDPGSLKEELFWMVSSMSTVAANPSLMVSSIMEYLKRDEVVNLSQAMQKLIVQLLDNPEALANFIDEGGLELAVDKLTSKHLSGPSHKQGLVSSLMNYLKLPPQLINMSTPAGKKTQPAIVETVNGLFNIAPLCTISCGNPTAQAADILLEGGGTATSGRGACAARRVRAAAWSYHFFSADDASLTLTLTLPYAVRLHEVQLQPHLTSLATCPGAVGVEAGCGGTLAPLGAPQDTSGMTFIRLVIARPVVATTVQLRLYKPRDSSNMGLLQLRLLAALAFSTAVVPSPPTNNWASVVACCTRGGSLVSAARWSAVCGAGAVAALCACVAAGGQSAPPAHRALLAAAAALPHHRAQILRALLHMDNHAYAHAFQISPNRRDAHGGNGGVVAICCLVRALCRRCPEVSVRTYLQWLEGGAPPAPEPDPALAHTLAAVLWILQSKQSMENLHELITDDLFELVYLWVNMVPESSLLKKALDAILCSMCYIRPELFKVLLEYLEIPMDQDESMEGLTDDTKVHSSPRLEEGPSDAHVAWRIPAQRLFTAARAAMSPATTLALLHSRLPAAVSAAIAEFCEAKLAALKQEDVQMTGKDVSGMEHACTLVEWVRMVCADRRVKEWAGGPGAGFWRPLLRLLCHPVRPEGSSPWQEMALFAKLEEKTIRLFAELTVCHPPNQKLFATTLHGILESQPSDIEGISGFTRALILRLVLSSERVNVALRWAGAGTESDSEAGAGAAPPHPGLACHGLLTLPIHTTIRMMLNDHLPPLPMIDDATKLSMDTSPSHSGTASVLRSASDTAISTVVGAWELSLAAATASKDKRLKDVKNTTLKQNIKKRISKAETMANTEAKLDDLLESPVRVQVEGLEGNIKGATNLAQLCAAVPHVFGPHLTLHLHIDTTDTPTEWWRPTTAGNPENYEGDPEAPPQYEGGCGVLREFGACGGLALVAARLPRPHAPAPDPPQPNHHHHDLDWVKLDDPYEEVVELGASTATSSSEEGAQAGIPAHALVALGLLLKLPGYAAALLDQGARAVHLLRLLLGVAHTEDGRSIAVSGGGTGGTAAWSLGTLPFRVVCVLLERAPRAAPAGAALRASLLHCGAARLLLACLSVFTHHRPNSNDNSQASNGSTGKSEEKSQLYWAKGTGFGTGSTQQSWNVEQALHRQRTEEEHVTVLLQVLASYMNPGEVWPPEESTPEEGIEADAPTPIDETEEDPSADLPQEFLDLVASSSLVPAICSYLRNDSVLDMSRHIPLYVCVLRVARALHALRSPRLAAALRPVPRLLAMMTTTTNSYAAKLRMSKKNIFGKMTYSQRFTSSSNSELSEEDEGLATLIGDIQATSALMCREELDAESNLRCMPAAATRDQRYIELMRTMQFETFEMIAECPESGFRFTVPYHFEGTVRAAGERAHPTRMKRLAQEASTLATSLPLSYSSSVFVRTDMDRLDVMKVLITGPSDTPYANGCFILDVYFPAEYPSVPMLINLETTGRHSVRFNPNLYNDGKVCLSVLNTWHGRPEEKWNAHTSSFLQVLVSIQSLILVPEPYFNEPGYERSRGTRVGAAASTEYNSNIYQACVRWAMLDHLRNPQPCFKEVIQTHFWLKRNEIIQTVSSWIAELEGQSGDERTQRSIQLNLMALKRHYVKLQEELAKLTCPAGLEDLDEPFTLPACPSPPPPAPAAAVPAPVAAAPPPAAAATAPAPAPAPDPPLDAPTSDDIDHDMEKIVSQVLD